MATPPTSSAQAETATPAGGPAPASAPAAPPAKSGKAKRVLGVVALILLGVVAYEGYRWFTFGRFHESTDDAYLQADLVVLQARESGYITEIAIAPNAPVSRGQIIARIDPRDYEIALTAAQNSLEVAKSAGLQLEAQIVAAEATVRQGEALLIAAEAQNDGAQKAYQRARELRTNSAGTQAALDAAEANAKSAAAEVESAKATIAQAQAQLGVLRAQLDTARLDVRVARTQVERAQLDLDFTTIRAPFDGILTERQIQVGSFVAAGSRLGTLVPVQNLYVGANFKETQIADIHPGAKVGIRVDAWPKERLSGMVESLTAGTGQVFSLLPSSNATGNFTKVVQRVPVRITLDEADRNRLPLRPGMSVVVEVDTRTGENRPLLPAPAAQGEQPAAATSKAEQPAATTTTTGG